MSLPLCPLTGKTSYPNRFMAYKAMIAMVKDPYYHREKGMVLVVYRCQCNKWHIGNNANKKRRDGDRD